MQDHTPTIARQIGIRQSQVSAVCGLLDNGSTIPFIARYRKEATDGLDELQLTAIRDSLQQFQEVDKRRAAIVKSLRERELLTPALQKALTQANSLTELEDLYLPHRPRRRTRAAIAREKGLESMAQALFSTGNAPLPKPEVYLAPDKELHTVEDVMAGARDILAEWISEDGRTRSRLRKLFAAQAVITSRAIEKNREAGQKFQDYFDREEPAARAPGHRLLAMFRGEQEQVLRLSIRPLEAEAMEILHHLYSRRNKTADLQLKQAAADSYKRLLAPSLENELRTQLKERADQEAISVFAANLEELLLAPPLGQKTVMALDPGFRTGAKLVCLDSQGALLHHTTIYPTLSKKQQQEAAETVGKLCKRYSIEAIAIGNGTAGRETEAFIRSLALPSTIMVTMVDESGASIYSASAIARSEFPDHDVTVRGAVSIGRRLQDPLAELVKLDPQSIGVGQYQHDVQQKALRQGLDDVVIRCVNMVGVDVNTASESLLTYISGVGPGLARNLIAYRTREGSFKSRRELLKVPRLGARAFEQCAGFLRIGGAANPLDNSAVHPERYWVVEQMARDCGCTVAELMAAPELRRQIDLERYVTEDIGRPTLEDILVELDKPARDPRTAFTAFTFAQGIHTMEDLKEGMQLPGIVTNVTRFGAFVDIGVHQDGLVHISQLADKFVSDPSEIVKVRQHVHVRVIAVDIPRKRIGLSMRRPSDQ